MIHARTAAQAAGGAQTRRLTLSRADGCARGRTTNDEFVTQQMAWYGFRPAVTPRLVLDDEVGCDSRHRRDRLAHRGEFGPYHGRHRRIVEPGDRQLAGRLEPNFRAMDTAAAAMSSLQAKMAVGGVAERSIRSAHTKPSENMKLPV